MFTLARCAQPGNQSAPPLYPSSVTVPVVDVIEGEDANRLQVEAFIKAAYYRAYGARIEIGYSTLIRVRSIGRPEMAAAGVRLGGNEPFFLEHYVGEPAESLLTKIHGYSVSRSRIAEIGNLASSNGGLSLALYAALIDWLDQRDITHFMITATEDLYRRFAKLGLSLEVLADASEHCIPNAKGTWGRYYDTKPKVMTGSIAAGLELGRRLAPVYRIARPR